MKVDSKNSIYQEAPGVRQEFDHHELRRLRFLLRRLRFLETSIASSGGLETSPESGGAAFAEWECEALEWVLTEIGFLATRAEVTS
jgi:hypothetical protein